MIRAMLPRDLVAPRPSQASISRWLFVLAVLAAIVGIPENAVAGTLSIPITNFGFEDPAIPTINSGPIPGWILTGNGGIWNINNYSNGAWNVPAPEGNQIAYLSPSSGSSASITQTLTATLQPLVYTLTGYVGQPISVIHEVVGPSPDVARGFTAEILAGVDLLASASGSAPTGSFQQFTLTFDGTGSPDLGLPFTIELSASQEEMGFDDIVLTAQTFTPAQATPEPALLGPLLAIGLGALGLALRARTGFGLCRS